MKLCFDLIGFNRKFPSVHSKSKWILPMTLGRFEQRVLGSTRQARLTFSEDFHVTERYRLMLTDSTDKYTRVFQEWRWALQHTSLSTQRELARLSLRCILQHQAQGRQFVTLRSSITTITPTLSSTQLFKRCFEIPHQNRIIDINTTNL